MIRSNERTHRITHDAAASDPPGRLRRSALPGITGSDSESGSGQAGGGTPWGGEEREETAAKTVWSPCRKPQIQSSLRPCVKKRETQRNGEMAHYRHRGMKPPLRARDLQRLCCAVTTMTVWTPPSMRPEDTSTGPSMERASIHNSIGGWETLPSGPSIETASQGRKTFPLSLFSPGTQASYIKLNSKSL